MGNKADAIEIEREEAMDALLGELANLYPNTVTKCHVVIARLEQELRDGSLNAAARRKLDLEIKILSEQVSDHERTIETLGGQITDLEKQIEEYEENYRGDTADAVQAFLDECERVGPLRYDVPQTPRAMQAIVHLHDVVGRCA